MSATVTTADRFQTFQAARETEAQRREEETQLRATIQAKADQFAADVLGKAGIKK